VSFASSDEDKVGCVVLVMQKPKKARNMRRHLEEVSEREATM
jgi:hypothetical protein